MNKHKIGLLVAGLLCATSTMAAEETKLPEPMGQALAHTCAACHGTHGELQGEHFVPLARMSPEEFIRSMKDFRDLKRASSIMSHIAEGYNDEQIERMAQYFASLNSGDQK